METLIANVIGGTQPQLSNSGRHRHSPWSLAVMQAKQGKHHTEKQPAESYEGRGVSTSV